MKVHPFADRFPMMSREELEDLAANIAERGQESPIMVDADGRLIDGRHRLAACKIAGIEPKTEVWKGENLEQSFREYILSVNVYRKHNSKSIRAMAVALVHPKPAKGGRPGPGAKKEAKDIVTSSNNIISLQPSERKALTLARAVIAEYGEDSNEVSLVMAGESLEDAYQNVLQLRKERKAQEEYLKSLRELNEADIVDEAVTGKLIATHVPIDPVMQKQIADAEKQFAEKKEEIRKREQAKRDAAAIEKAKRDDEQRLATLLKENAEAEVRLQALLESVGPEVPVIIQPEFIPTKLVVPQKRVNNNFAEQEKALGDLISIKMVLEKYAERPSIVGSENYLHSIKSCASHIIQIVQQIVENHQRAHVNHSTIRKVK